MKRVGSILILLLAFCGLADSAYLVQSEHTGTPLICTVQNLSGCTTIAHGLYTHVFGIPVAEYGMFFYGVLFVLAALELLFFNRVLRRVLQGVAFFGVGASIFFSLVQVLFIGEFCIYCVASAVITVLILASASLLEPIRRKVPIPPPPPFFALRMPPNT